MSNKLKEDQLLMAEHQLLGFFHAENGYSLRDLVIGMGLTNDEFKELLATGAVEHIHPSYLAEIHRIVTEPPIASGDDRTTSGAIGQP